MDANIQRWGNSSAIRLPKPILREANITENDSVEIIAKENEIIIKKTAPRHMTFAERMEGFNGAYAFDDTEIIPVGDEVFWE